MRQYTKKYDRKESKIGFRLSIYIPRYLPADGKGTKYKKTKQKKKKKETKIKKE